MVYSDIADGYRKFVISWSKSGQAVVVVFDGYDNLTSIDTGRVRQLDVLKYLFSLTNPVQFPKRSFSAMRKTRSSLSTSSAISYKILASTHL